MPAILRCSRNTSESKKFFCSKRHSPCEEETQGKGGINLPAGVTTKGSVVGAGETTTTATATAATSTAAAPATVTAATTVAHHLGKARVDVLLGFSQDIDQIASLLGVWKSRLVDVCKDRKD